MKLIFEKSVLSRRALRLPNKDVDTVANINDSLLRTRVADLPELSELDVVRHFTELSRRNYGVDTNFYPLGSCTMKYNPKVAEHIARLPGFTELHPLLARLPGGEKLTQGALAVLYETDLLLREICGLAAFTTGPFAGAHGELTGVMIMAAYHRHKGNDKRTILIPDNAHGTNPASAALAGYQVQTIPSDKTGLMDVTALGQALNDQTAGVMLTCPNTLGLFHPRVKQICRMVHDFDALMYYDGANLNALLGYARPGEMGFDIVHVNLHKTFATPHGGGGPGAGPVGLCKNLIDYLPVPIVHKKKDGSYFLDYDRPASIGPIGAFYGNFAIILRAYAYILMLGREGLPRVAENAVLNANYLKEKLKPYFDLPFDQLCKHECVFSASRQAKNGIHALDIAKALIDRGFHPPTIYFPLTVPEALMIEPTETESRQSLDAFIQAMIEIAQLAQTNPQQITSCPQTTVVSRLDETSVARHPDLACL